MWLTICSFRYYWSTSTVCRTSSCSSSAPPSSSCPAASWSPARTRRAGSSACSSRRSVARRPPRPTGRWRTPSATGGAPTSSLRSIRTFLRTSLSPRSTRSSSSSSCPRRPCSPCPRTTSSLPRRCLSCTTTPRATGRWSLPSLRQCVGSTSVTCRERVTLARHYWNFFIFFVQRIHAQVTLVFSMYGILCTVRIHRQDCSLVFSLRHGLLVTDMFSGNSGFSHQVRFFFVSGPGPRWVFVAQLFILLRKTSFSSKFC